MIYTPIRIKAFLFRENEPLQLFLEQELNLVKSRALHLAVPVLNAAVLMMLFVFIVCDQYYYILVS